MQPYFILNNEKQPQPNPDLYPYVSTKISSTSTADSYAPYYPYQDDEEYSREKMDANFITRFGSMGLDDKMNLAGKEATEPRRHVSELPYNLPPKVYPKLSYSPYQKLENPEPQSNPRSFLSTTEVPSITPPGLIPSMNANATPYVPYNNTITRQSTSNLSQHLNPIPLYPVPQYYSYQPEMVPYPVLYGYYNYPETHVKPEPRRFFSSKKQTSSALVEQPATIYTELSEKAIMLVKEYERSGDCTKLKGEVNNIAKVQSGSRFLQNELDKSNPEFLTFILQEVILTSNSIRLMLPSLNFWLITSATTSAKNFLSNVIQPKGNIF